MNTLEATLENIMRLGQALSASWGEDTCWPGCWNPENPAAGQCRVTAVVVQDHFGGDILFASITGIGTHYWNLLAGGREQDYTRGQFPPDTLIPAGIVKTREEVVNAESMKRAYDVLSNRLRQKLEEFCK